MNGINLATAFHRLAKLAVVNDPAMWSNHQFLKQSRIFDILVRTVVLHITHHSMIGIGPDPIPEREEDYEPLPESMEMPVTSMSIVSWSFTTLRLRHEPLFAKIEWLISPRMDQLKPFEFSNLLWAFSKMCLSSDRLFEAAAVRMQHRRKYEFKSQCLATVAWSFTTSEKESPETFASIANELSEVAEDMKPQEISNTLWAFAKNRCNNMDLFNLLGHVAIKKNKIQDFKSQELSITVWAFATVGARNDILFNHVEYLAIAKRGQMSPQHISNILLAYAKLKVELKTHMPQKLLEVAEPMLDQHKRQELSIIVWAASQVVPNASEFFGAVMRECYNRLQEFSLNAIANLIGDLAGVSTTKPEYLSFMIDEFIQRLDYHPNQAQLGFFIFESCGPMLANPAYSDLNLMGSIDRLCELIARQVPLLKNSQAQQLEEVLEGNVEGLSSSNRECVEAALGLRKKNKKQPKELQKDFETSKGAIHESAPTGGRSAAGESSQKQSDARTFLPPGRVAVLSSCESEESGLYKEILKLDLACLLRESSDGSKHLLNPEQVRFLKIIGAGAPERSRIIIRHGILNEQVVLKRCAESLVVKEHPPHPQLLQPIARISSWGDSSATAMSSSYALHALAYRHCRHGSLFEWVSARAASNKPVQEAEIANFALSLLQGVDALVHDDPLRSITALRPKDIFVDENEIPVLRKPIVGHMSESSWGSGLLWLSPEEATGWLGPGVDIWPSVAYRIGLLLYSMGGEAGKPLLPFVGMDVESVLAWMTRSPDQAPILDFNAYQGSPRLREAISACVRYSGRTTPSRCDLVTFFTLLSQGSLDHFKITEALDVVVDSDEAGEQLCL
jgi:hypothetical protein